MLTPMDRFTMVLKKRIWWLALLIAGMAAAVYVAVEAARWFN
jgi:hypothetical protein